MSIDRDAIYKRIRRVRNYRNPYESIAQNMENNLLSYFEGLILEDELMRRLAQSESEAANVKNILPAKLV